MTCEKVFLFVLFLSACLCGAPFVPLDTVHQAYSEFEVNLILNENRNHPIILTTVSNNKSKALAIEILQNTHRLETYSAFSVLVDCNQFNQNLNQSLGICPSYHQQPNNHSSEDGLTDKFFSCQIFLPSEVKIRQKGHTIMKNHNQEAIPDGQHFNAEYLAEAVRKNIADFVSYIEDQYELTQFLQQSSHYKVSKQPKLLYFDQNLLAPVFLRKLSALLDGKIQVAVIDDPPIAKLYDSSYDSLILLEYSFDKKKYEHRKVIFDESSPQSTILEDARIIEYQKIKKNRDILLDFQHSNETIYQFDSLHQIQFLQTHGRPIVLEVSTSPLKYQCSQLQKTAKKYGTLLNYVCYNQGNVKDIDEKGLNHEAQYLFVLDSIKSGVWIDKPTHLLEKLPRNTSRQIVQTETEADFCLRVARTSQRDPLFFYYSEKQNNDSIVIMNYLNSLPEVTSLFYICQIYLPDESLVKRFSLKINTLFTLQEPDRNGGAKKLQHTHVSNFLSIKMFMREIAIQRMLRVYEDRILNNQIQKVSTSQQLTDKCFNRKCIVALLATGRYREEEEMKMLKELKLQYEQLFRFVWIDGICHWDVPRQLKLLKKKEKVIDRSYAFFYNEKDITYNLWESKKFWDKKELEKWIKSLKNARKLNHLKFAIDIEDRICKAKKESPGLPQQL